MLTLSIPRFVLGDKLHSVESARLGGIGVINSFTVKVRISNFLPSSKCTFFDVAVQCLTGLGGRPRHCNGVSEEYFQQRIPTASLFLLIQCLLCKRTFLPRNYCSS